jgi:hypothetical protein
LGWPFVYASLGWNLSCRDEVSAMKVTFHMNSGFVGTNRKETIEMDDDLTDEDIEESWREWVWGYIDGYWEKECTDEPAED